MYASGRGGVETAASFWPPLSTAAWGDRLFVRRRVLSLSDAYKRGKRCVRLVFVG